MIFLPFHLHGHVMSLVALALGLLEVEQVVLGVDVPVVGVRVAALWDDALEVLRLGQPVDVVYGGLDVEEPGSDWTPNGTNPGLFQIRFQCIWRRAPNALKSNLKKPRIYPIWGQFDPL